MAIGQLATVSGAVSAGPRGQVASVQATVPEGVAYGQLAFVSASTPAGVTRGQLAFVSARTPAQFIVSLNAPDGPLEPGIPFLVSGVVEEGEVTNWAWTVLNGTFEGTGPIVSVTPTPTLAGEDVTVILAVTGSIASSSVSETIPVYEHLEWYASTENIWKPRILMDLN